MQSWGIRASRAGSVAGGCILLFAMGISSSASAQTAPAGGGMSGLGTTPGNHMFGSGIFGRPDQAAEPLIDTRDFSVTPSVGLQETFTDNALLTPTNKKYDFITRPMLGADVNVNGPFTASMTGHVYYDAYVNNSQLSGVSGDAQGTGTYALIPNFLSIDANGMLMNTSVSTIGTPAVNRVGPANQAQLATYDIGPHLTTTLDDFADMNVMGRFAQIFFSNPTGSTASLPFDSTILEGSAAIDTGTRYLGYQALTNAQVERDDHGFQDYGAQQSFFVGIVPQVRLIARGGYDNVYQAHIVNISAPMWSGGVEYTIDERSKITIETGERYNHAAWAGELDLQISDALVATGRYFEAIQPAQLQINSSFVSFIQPTTPVAQLPALLLNNNFTFNGNLDNQTTFNKEADFRLAYGWETQTIGVGANWNDRQYLSFAGHDRSLSSEVDYERSIAPDLRFNASVNYLRTFSNPFYGQNELYSGQVALQYDLNSTMRATGGYAYQRQAPLATTFAGTSENVIYAAVVKRF